jgi:hypothetical protein
MPQKEAHTEQGEKSPLFNFAAADFAVTTKRQIDAITKAQSEALDNFQEMNQQWLDRIQAEASLASELASKLTAARSVPDAITAYQNWGSRRFEMMAEDTKHLWDDTQKFIQVSARVLQSQGVSLSQ